MAEKVPCAKCGLTPTGEKHEMRHHYPGDCLLSEETEHIHYTCEFCGYQWSGPPEDAE